MTGSSLMRRFRGDDAPDGAEAGTPAADALGNGNAGPLQLILSLEEGGAISPTSLDLSDPNLTFDRWQAIGRFLGMIDRSAKWWLGDWLNHGEDVFGELAAQAVEDTVENRYDLAERVTGLAHDTLLNVSSVCRKVARPRRREELSFWIHAEVAPLEPDEQERWLETAVEEGLNRAQLRAAIKSEQNPAPPPEEPAGDGGDRMSRSEQVEAAARFVYRSAQPFHDQPIPDGYWVIPPEAHAQLSAALGEE